MCSINHDTQFEDYKAASSFTSTTRCGNLILIKPHGNICPTDDQFQTHLSGSIISTLISANCSGDVNGCGGNFNIGFDSNLKNPGADVIINCI